MNRKDSTTHLAGNLRTGPLSASKTAGLTMVETLVGLLVAAIFLSITLQMLVTATALRVKNEQFDNADIWIRADLESVKRLAQQYEMTQQPYSPKCDAATATGGVAAGFIQNTQFGLGGSQMTDGPRTIKGESFVLKRTASYLNSSDPKRLVRLDYNVSAPGASEAIATKTIEIIPYAALKCGYSLP